MADPTPAIYDVGAVVTLSCLFLNGNTLGSITVGQNTLYVRDASGLTQGQPIFIAGAGAVGGDLLTTVSSINGQTVILAATAASTVTLAVVGQPANPGAVTCKVKLPDRTSQTLTTANPSTGKFTASFTPTLEGVHYARWTGTTPAAGDSWREFVVRPERGP